MFCFFSTTRFGNVHSNFTEFHILIIFRDHSAKKCCQKVASNNDTEHTLTGIFYQQSLNQGCGTPGDPQHAEFTSESNYQCHNQLNLVC